MKNKKIWFVILLTFMITATASVFTTAFVINKTDPIYRLRRVMEIIDNKYVEDIDFRELEEKAIKAVVDSTEDKYAVYYDEKTARETIDYIAGYYTGIGIGVSQNSEENLIEIISVYDSSPAEKAGIKAGDYILRINGKTYDAFMIDKAISIIRGKELDKSYGDDIVITVLHDGKEREITLKREKIELERADSKITDDGYCYINYTGFAAKSEKNFENMVKKAEKENVKGIILDLRDNPGGEFDSAINMCDFFLNNGNIMYTVEKNDKKVFYNAKKDACDLPLAILINENSASASEIVSGSLQSRERAILIGKKTYGKGVSQSIIYLNSVDMSEGALKLTTCKNYLPNDVWLNNGVVPDIEVDAEKCLIDNIENDEAYKAAAKALANKE